MLLVVEQLNVAVAVLVAPLNVATGYNPGLIVIVLPELLPKTIEAFAVQVTPEQSTKHIHPDLNGTVNVKLLALAIVPERT